MRDAAAALLPTRHDRPDATPTTARGPRDGAPRERRRRAEGLPISIQRRSHNEGSRNAPGDECLRADIEVAASHFRLLSDPIGEDASNGERAAIAHARIFTVACELVYAHMRFAIWPQVKFREL